MNTRITPPIQSRQASVIPYIHQISRNGHLSFGTSSSICTMTQSTVKPTPIISNHRLNKQPSTDTLEMQTLANQRQTLEAFDELENLVPSIVPTRASIMEINAFLQDQEDPLSTPNELDKR